MSAAATLEPVPSGKPQPSLGPVATSGRVPVPDNAPVTLSRIKGGDKGPVLLVHGVAVSSQMFRLPTVQENFVQFLVRHGFDVWLVDWRGSTAHPLRQFTLDEAARFDIPAAVEQVRAATGAPTIQVVAHCAGSVVVCMAMSQGRLPHVRSLVASQVALHTVLPAASVLKARVHLADRLARLGTTRMSPADDDGLPLFQLLFGRFSDAVHHECSSTFCHRLTFIYGHLYHHARLNQATHDALAAQFGACNILTLRHFSQLALTGHATMFDYGRRRNLDFYRRPAPPSYLDPTHFNLPILFLASELNDTWLPVSSKRTFDWLVHENGPGGYTRRVIDGYGHLDTFMGTTANEDVYPLILNELVRY